MLLKRYLGRLAFYEKRIPFAKPKAEAVTSITQGVKPSFAVGAKSRQLLEQAKRAVELLIEEGEEAAVQFLEA